MLPAKHPDNRASLKTLGEYFGLGTQEHCIGAGLADRAKAEPEHIAVLHIFNQGRDL